MIFTKSGKIVDVLERHEWTTKGTPLHTQDYVLQDTFGDIIVFSVVGKKNIDTYNIQMHDEIAIDLEVESRIYKGKVYHKMNCLRVYRPVGAMQQTRQQAIKKQKTTTKKDFNNDFNIDDLPL